MTANIIPLGGLSTRSLSHFPLFFSYPGEDWWTQPQYYDGQKRVGERKGTVRRYEKWTRTRFWLTWLDTMTTWVQMAFLSLHDFLLILHLLVLFFSCASHQKDLEGLS